MNLLLTNGKSKHKIILFTFAVLTAVFSFGYFVYSPQQMQIAALALEVRENKEALGEMNDFLNQHPDFALYERNIRAKQRLLEAMLPRQLDLSAFIAQVERISAESRVKLIQVNPQERIVRPNYSEARVFVEVQGDYAEFLDFLKRLEQLDRFYTIYETKLWSAHGGLNGNLGVSIYTYDVSSKMNQRELSEPASNSE